MIIGGLFISTICLHGWLTWDALDSLPPDISQSDRELFEYSLFLEAFAFAVMIVYFLGPRIYVFFGDQEAVLKFNEEERGLKRTVNVYVGMLVILRRLTVDRYAGVPPLETLVAIAIAAIPIIILSCRYLAQRRRARKLASMRA